MSCEGVRQVFFILLKAIVEAPLEGWGERSFEFENVKRQCRGVEVNQERLCLRHRVCDSGFPRKFNDVTLNGT